jgi:DNA-directed RNA polymerase specialized sigma24 family protein
MRLVLVDHARRRKADKRIGGRRQVELADFLVSVSPRTDDMLILDQALTRLAKWDPRQTRLVELVYFGGLTLEEAALRVSGAYHLRW